MPGPWKRVNSRDVYDWIGKTVVKKDRRTNHRVCPFAEKTIKDKAIQVVPAKIDLVDQIGHCCDLFDCLALDIVIVYVQYKITEQDLQALCQQAHDINPEYAVLYDHPDNDGKHKGVSFSFGKCPLIMIQKLDKLKQAQAKLKKSGWYEAWGIDPYDTMFY